MHVTLKAGVKGVWIKGKNNNIKVANKPATENPRKLTDNFHLEEG